MLEDSFKTIWRLIFGVVWEQRDTNYFYIFFRTTWCPSSSLFFNYWEPTSPKTSRWSSLVLRRNKFRCWWPHCSWRRSRDRHGRASRRVHLLFPTLRIKFPILQVRFPSMSNRTKFRMKSKQTEKKCKLKVKKFKEKSSNILFVIGWKRLNWKTVLLSDTSLKRDSQFIEW